MNFDYVSLRRLERFFTDLKAWLASKYATKDVATTSTDGLISATDKTKLDGIATAAQVNVIESITAGGTALPISDKAVNIPLADGTATGVVTLTVESGKVTEISGMPVGGSELPEPSAANQLLTSTAGGSDWKQLAKTTVGEPITDESGSALTDESGDPLYDERGVDLWSSFDGTGFLAGRAAADTNGNDIAETYATKDTFNGSVPGLVPVAAQGTNTRYLRPDGTWSEIPPPSVFSGSDPGLVPAATAGDATKALRGDGTWGDVSLVNVISSSAGDDTLSGTTLTSVVHPNTYKEITVADTVTKLVVQIEEAVVGILQQTGFQFTLGANSVLSDFEVHRGVYSLPVIGVTTFTPGKTYQGSIVNGLVTIAEFEPPSLSSVLIGNNLYETVIVNDRIWIKRNIAESFGMQEQGINTYKTFEDKGMDPQYTGYYYSQTFLYGTLTENEYPSEFRQEFLDIIPNGWRVPTYEDFLSIPITAVNIKRDLWSTRVGGLDLAGLAIEPTGKAYYYSSWTCDYRANESDLWMQRYDNSNNKYYSIALPQTGSEGYDILGGYLGQANRYAYDFAPLRFCRDLT